MFCISGIYVAYSSSQKKLSPWVINNMEQCMHCLSFGFVSITRLYLKKKKKEPLLVSPKQSLDPFQL